MLDELEENHPLIFWDFRQWRLFWVIQELYRQQEWMHRQGEKRIDDRIVNLAQPYVRPIVRGKAGAETEFGAKLNVSETEGFVRVDQMSFDNFNESTFLTEQVETYRELYGYYPELVLVDRIYLTRANRTWLKERGIRNSGKTLGRPALMNRYEKRKRKKKQDKRSELEDKFGQAKSKYGLDDIQMRRSDTSYACIGLIMLALNVLKLGQVAGASFLADLKGLFYLLLSPSNKIGSTLCRISISARAKTGFAIPAAAGG